MMNQRKRSILFLLFTAGLFAGVLFCTETTQAKVKTTIKNGVCTVSGKGAMTDDTSYNKKIKKVIIKDGVTSLPEEAFAGCLKLKEISIADSVKSIGACAFMQTDLREITIPNSVKKLGNSVLSSCKKLTKVKMPGNVKIIYGSDEYFPVFQFDVDSPVKTIELTSSLNLEIFMYLSAENIVVSKNDPKYTSIDGLLYTKDGKSLVRIPNLRKKAVIADGCEEFCTTAVEWAGDDDGDPYMGCEDLKTIVLPESIRTINTKKHLTRWGTSSYAEEHHGLTAKCHADNIFVVISTSIWNVQFKFRLPFLTVTNFPFAFLYPTFFNVIADSSCSAFLFSSPSPCNIFSKSRIISSFRHF